MVFEGTVDSYSVYRTERPSVTFVVNREVVSPVIFRNSESDRSETQEFGGKLHAQVNPEKFISQERLRGLHLLRYLTQEFDGDLEEFDTDNLPTGLISSDYTYNEPSNLPQATNLDTLTYGIAGTGDETYSIKSHVVEGYSYSMEEYSINDPETRNAVYESGTMRNEEGEQSASLYDISPVQPGNSFVSFVTVEAGNPEMLLYVMHNILNTESYGARNTRMGKNIKNTIAAIVTSPHPHSLSSGELVMDYHDEGRDNEESIQEYINSVRDESWTVYSDEIDEFQEPPEWYTDYQDLARFEDEETMFEEFQDLTQNAFEVLALEDN